MSDLIDRQAAIETVRKAQSIGQAHRMLIQLPSAQPTGTNTVQVEDCISREAALTALERDEEYDKDIPNRADGVRDAIITISALPSAQPDVPDTYVGDMISRQAAISEIMKDIEDRSLHDDPATPEDYAEGYDEGIRNAAAIVLQMPSAQPEIIRCKDCKHNPKYEWFGCPMSHLSEAQRPETAWCWKAERRTDE